MKPDKKSKKKRKTKNKEKRKKLSIASDTRSQQLPFDLDRSRKLDEGFKRCNILSLWKTHCSEYLCNSSSTPVPHEKIPKLAIDILKRNSQQVEQFSGNIEVLNQELITSVEKSIPKSPMKYAKNSHFCDSVSELSQISVPGPCAVKPNIQSINQSNSQISDKTVTKTSLEDSSFSSAVEKECLKNEKDKLNVKKSDDCNLKQSLMHVSDCEMEDQSPELFTNMNFSQSEETPIHPSNTSPKILNYIDCDPKGCIQLKNRNFEDAKQTNNSKYYTLENDMNSDSDINNEDVFRMDNSGLDVLIDSNVGFNALEMFPKDIETIYPNAILKPSKSYLKRKKKSFGKTFTTCISGADDSLRILSADSSTFNKNHCLPNQKTHDSFVDGTSSELSDVYFSSAVGHDTSKSIGSKVKNKPNLSSEILSIPPKVQDSPLLVEFDQKSPALDSQDLFKDLSVAPEEEIMSESCLECEMPSNPVDISFSKDEDSVNVYSSSKSVVNKEKPSILGEAFSVYGNIPLDDNFEEDLELFLNGGPSENSFTSQAMPSSNLNRNAEKTTDVLERRSMQNKEFTRTVNFQKGLSRKEKTATRTVSISSADSNDSQTLENSPSDDEMNSLCESPRLQSVGASTPSKYPERKKK